MKIRVHNVDLSVGEVTYDYSFSNCSQDSLLTDYDLLLPALPKDHDVNGFIETTETEREKRTDRIDAGDEKAALNFSARKASAPPPVSMNKRAPVVQPNLHDTKRQVRGGGGSGGYRR